MDLTRIAGQTGQRAQDTITDSLSEHVMEIMRQRLQAGSRHNVFPNKYDKSRPFRVSINYDGWKNVGTFTDIDAATAVGAIIAVAYYGRAANTGKFDVAKAQQHPEYINWCIRNTDLVERAEANS